MDGGYDEGYRSCSCFWGSSPGSMILLLDACISNYDGLDVLDMGCGEGKNAAYLARKGALVTGVDVSELAIRNANAFWPGIPRMKLSVGDVTEFAIQENGFDVIIAYGVLHCLPSASDIERVLGAMQRGTKAQGYNVVVAFNDRSHDLSAHPGFCPTLRPHESYVNAYAEWLLVHASDHDLRETHPHNNVPHHHSITRIVAQKVN